MDAAAVQKILDAELAGRTAIENVHGVDLKKCLVTPTIQLFDGYPPGSPPWELWVVLEEDPVGKAAYKIAYDPESSQFCLCYRGTYVGHHGTFERTLKNM